jgi:ABC-type cobalamin/Fe3+-siderophores transport system ATPase subunit
MVNRLVNPLKSNSFFLFGPRGVGKSFLLKSILFSQKPSDSECYYIDLLLPKTRLEYLREPDRLIRITQQLPKSVKWIIIDEIQKVPSLLDVVHHLIENSSFYFALTGSSARKLKRNAANLLGGRAFVYHLHPYVYLELKENFNLDMALQWGTLPKIFTFNDDAEKRKYLKTYIATFIKEEIKKNSISERYHYLPQTLDLEMQDLVIDFKCYISMPIQELINQHNDNYFCTLNELFRERLSQRFASYFTRIGLPVIEYDYFITTQEDFESKKQRSDISNGIYCVFVDNSNEDDFKVYRVKDLQIKELTVSGQKALKKKYIKREFINIRISSSDAEKLFTNIY